MNRKFSAGDRVRVIRGLRAGQVATIVNGPRPARISRASPWYGEIPNGYPVYELDLPPLRHAVACVYPGEYLEPYYDGNERVSWSDCVWKPRELRV